MRLKNFVIIIIVIIFVLSVIFLPFILLKITFKTTYKNIIKENLLSIKLNSNELNTTLVLSVIKAESNFNKFALSNSDAYGLMQLKYSTAKEMANKLNFDISVYDLYNEEINIKLGINYLNYLFEIFNDKQLVLMSYNAGLNKVKSWINNNELTLNNGLYETPFKETTNYLKRVLQNEKIYKLMGIK